MFCTNCGAQVSDKATFCVKCGAKIPQTTIKTSSEAEDAALRLIVPVGRSVWAIASGYLGLLSFLPLIGLVIGMLAVFCGILAIVDINKHPEKHGLVRAWFGIVMGGLMAILNMVMICCCIAA